MNFRYIFYLTLAFFSIFSYSYASSVQNKKEEIKNSEKTQLKVEKDEEQNQKEKEIDESKNEKFKDFNRKFKMKVGGMINLQYGYTSDHSFRSYAPQLSIARPGDFFPNSFNLHSSAIDVSPEIEINKHKIGIFLRMPFTQTSNTDIRSASQQFIYIEANDIFRLELGSTFGVATKMKVDPYNISSGDKGVYGDWWRYINMPIYNTSGLDSFTANSLNYGFGPAFMIYPALPHEAGFTTGDVLNQGYIANQSPYNIFNTNNFSTSIQGLPIQGARSNKISLLTARFYGLQFGVSYSPDTNNGGVFQGFSKSSVVVGGGVKNYVAFAVNYKKQFGNFGTAFSFTYESGTPKDSINFFTNGDSTAASADNMIIRRNDLSAFALGSQLNYKNFSVSYSFIYWGKSLNPKSGFINSNGYDFADTANKISYAHVAAFAANYGPINFSLQYMHSSRMGNVADLFSIGTDLNIGNLKYIKIQPYVEYTFAVLKPNSVFVSGNSYKADTFRANIFIVGIRASF